MTLRIRGLLGIAVSLALLAVLVWEIDPARVLQALGRSRVEWLPLIFVPLSADLALRTARWHVILARAPRPGYRDTFRYLAIGYLANNVLPVRLGELVRAHLLGTREGVGRSRALGSIAMERGLDVAAAAGLGAVASQLAGVHGAVVTAFATLALAGGAVLLAMAVVPDRLARPLVDAVVRRMSVGRLSRVADIVGNFAHSLLDASTPARILAGLGLSIAAWLVTSVLFAVTSGSLGIPLSPAGIVAIAVAANIGAALPSAPAGIGPFEAGVVIVATSLGVDPAAAFALGLLSHLCTTLPVSIVGAWELGRVHWNLRLLRLAGEESGDDAPGAGTPMGEGATLR